MKKARKNQKIPDLRYGADEQAHVMGGVVYRKNCVVQVCYDNGQVETWWLDPSEEGRMVAKDFFKQKRDELI